MDNTTKNLIHDLRGRLELINLSFSSIVFDLKEGSIPDVEEFVVLKKALKLFDEGVENLKIKQGK
ncbi:MAG: hypothetical protein QE271_10595 [Bacteriovoracaceae bacterium]|nr:hypothetical protein [Bacteriovoracaceae bacterium]